MLDSSGIDKLQQMHGHLREVSSATETATTDILDGLGRAAGLVEQLDGPSTPTDAERHLMAALLRDELSNVVNHLQFQDITGQQLKHIGNLLADMNRRITQVVKIFSPPAVTFATEPALAAPSALARAWNRRRSIARARRSPTKSSPSGLDERQPDVGLTSPP